MAFWSRGASHWEEGRAPLGQERRGSALGGCRDHGLPRTAAQAAGPAGEERRAEALLRPRPWGRSSSWLGVPSPGRDVVRVEPIQQKVTGMIKGMENQAHEERLKGLPLFSLEKRDRDVIAPCKSLHDY